MLSIHGSPRRRGWLPELELFAGCDRGELRELSQLVTMVNIRAGRVLCRQGEVAEQCFIVVEGGADVFVDNARVASVAAGDLIGELALLSHSAGRTATVVAATDMWLMVLSRRESASLAECSPTVHHRVLREATRRLVENATRRGPVS